MSLPQVTRRYARALYEVAIEAGELPAVEDDMITLSRLFSELPEVLAWCRAGQTHAASAAAFVRSAFLPYVGPLTGNTLKVAAEHDRLAAIPLLPSAFEATVESEGDTVHVTLQTAQSADPELVALVEAGISARTGKRPLVNHEILPDLVAGFRVLWSDRLVDRSVQGRMGALRWRLTSRGGEL